jgi:hypothetical protein
VEDEVAILHDCSARLLDEREIPLSMDFYLTGSRLPKRRPQVRSLSGTGAGDSSFDLGGIPYEETKVCRMLECVRLEMFAVAQRQDATKTIVSP